MLIRRTLSEPDSNNVSNLTKQMNGLVGFPSSSDVPDVKLLPPPEQARSVAA